MKSLHIFLAIICFCAFAKAQNTSPTTSADALVFKLGIGMHQKINTVEVTFLEVLEDSRCPKDVDCVWAGQAKIKVRIKEKGKAPIEKEFIFDALGKDVVLYTSKTSVIKAVRLSPYPNTSMAISDRVYYLEIRG
ncbi:hypothetical protein [uncultured Dokdonia sp.]|uniref:hypothetical protein n=1 Tax=uncultured Dokdonia sp. TaxID=575653 RepID=UPI0026129685|nr:hypothetical protein [uncultured Dokdonia sp.]